MRWTDRVVLWVFWQLAVPLLTLAVWFGFLWLVWSLYFTEVGE